MMLHKDPFACHSVAYFLRVFFFFYSQPEARLYYETKHWKFTGFLHVCIARHSALLPLSARSGTRLTSASKLGKVLSKFLKLQKLGSPSLPTPEYVK